MSGRGETAADVLFGGEFVVDSLVLAEVLTAEEPDEPIVRCRDL
jgi:hypothetical protein